MTNESQPEGNWTWFYSPPTNILEERYLFFLWSPCVLLRVPNDVKIKRYIKNHLSNVSKDKIQQTAVKLLPPRTVSDPRPGERKEKERQTEDNELILLCRCTPATHGYTRFVHVVQGRRHRVCSPDRVCGIAQHDQVVPSQRHGAPGQPAEGAGGGGQKGQWAAGRTFADS